MIVGAAIASAAVGTGRPLGLLWDLVAWLPRAGHPFGPACYSERAVPELANRMFQWLTDEKRVDDPAVLNEVRPARRILLATHSLGAVLGIAALYHLAAMVQNSELDATGGIRKTPPRRRSESSFPGSGRLRSVCSFAPTSEGSSRTCGDRLSLADPASGDKGTSGAIHGRAAPCQLRPYSRTAQRKRSLWGS